jgi:hypothetical protein
VVQVDDANVAVCDQELDLAAAMGSTEAYVVQPAAVAQGDGAGLIDFVVAYSKVTVWTRVGGACASGRPISARALVAADLAAPRSRKRSTSSAQTSSSNAKRSPPTKMWSKL